MKKLLVLFVLCILVAACALRPTVCQYWSWQKNDWKTVACKEYPHIRHPKARPATKTPELVITSTPEPTIEWTIVPTEGTAYP